MHYRISRSAQEGRSESCVGRLYCLPEQVGGYSPAHGPPLFAVNPAKLADPVSTESSPTQAPCPPGPQPSSSPLHSQDPLIGHEGCEEEGSPLSPSAAQEREPRGCQDVSTITDLCSGGDLPEVEIVSLLQERLPLYTLRADCLFGYDHDDWLHTPLLPPEAALQLTPQQIEETLKYFLLCSERVGQVTKTYHDIEAVTQLLEEKERDLELAARIGQSLLKQNRSLTERNELLDEQLEAAREEIAQLRHELTMRDDLLQLYASSAEDSEPPSACSTPMKHSESSASLGSYFHYDFLQQKLKGLEEENLKLRTEARDLTTETTNYEEQEQQLMMDCVQELASVNKQVAQLSEELARKVEDTVRQQEEISHLLAQIVDLQHRSKALSSENEELNQHLAASREVQAQLRSELSDLQDRYSECEDMLQEAREDIKNLRNKSLPNSTINRYSSLAVFPMDSLAAEIEGTMRKGLDSPAPPEYRSHPRRVFETVKAVNQAARLRSRCQSPQIPGSSPPSTRSSQVSTPRTSYYGSDSASVQLEDQPGASPALPDDPLSEAADKKLGQPGTPGGHDLEAALRRLSARQESHSSERPFFEVERERKLQALAAGGEGGGGDSSGFLTPNDSILSTGTNYSGSSQHSGSGLSCSSRSCLPDRLQIVKPLEGSVTLHQWQQLARPNLGGILYPRPGVLTKDFRELDVDLEQVYSLNDLEEDEPDLSLFPVPHSARVSQSCNNLPPTPPTNTITTCRILHPALELSAPPRSLRPRSLSSCGTSEGLAAPSGGAGLRRPRCESSTNLREHTRTHSASLGLVRLLQERGISAAVYTRQQGGRSELGSPPLARAPPGPQLARPPGEQDRGRASAAPCRKGRNIFSFNLVEKLRSLGLAKVAARGLIDPGDEAEEP
ncbi:TRAK1 protein, partial [Atractosteus spatula]|nr:TRAK1 protein [Atractosteus spatula]